PVEAMVPARHLPYQQQTPPVADHRRRLRDRTGCVPLGGAAFPLTGSLIAVRGALLESDTLTDLAPTLTWLAVLSAALLAAAALMLRIGEARAQRTGKLSLA